MNLKSIVIVLITLMLFQTCKKEDEVYNTFNPTIMTSFRGIVLDNNGVPISGVHVMMENESTTTSNKGLFTFNNISVESRTILKFRKEGLCETSRAINPKSDVANYLRVVMDNTEDHIIDATLTNTITTSDNASVTIPANGFQYNDGSTVYGNVKLSINTIKPNESNFSLRLPGSDLSATDSNGEDVRLYSYGMIDVTAEDANGLEVEINGGGNSLIRFPISGMQNAPSTIPLWYYNETTGIWEEEGTATKNGNFYEGYVSHFSTWNFDIPGEWAGLEGKITDCEGTGLANILVIVGQQSTSTNSSGEFDLFITPNQNHTLRIITNFGDTIDQLLSSVSINTVYDAGDITVCNSLIEGTVLDCNGNPSQNVLVYSNHSPLTYGYSDINGHFSFFFPTNIATQIYAEGFFGTTSTPVSTPTLSTGQVYNIGSIIMCESNGGATTVAQDKQNITNTFSSLENCIENFTNGAFTDAVDNFLNLDEGEILNDNWIEDMIDNIDGYLDLNAIDDNNKFDFATNTGTYTWNESAQTFSKIANPTNKIIIHFPSQQGLTNNDATFTLHSYSDILLYYDGENIYAPSNINAEIVVSGTQVFELNGNYTYDVGSPTPIPTNINTTFKFNPFTFTISGQRITSTDFEASMEISNGMNCSTSLDVEVKFAHNDYENLDPEQGDILEVNTTFEHDNMQIQVNVDGDLFTYEDPSNNLINSMADANVYYSGNKIGELVSQLNSSNDEELYIIYSDGSSQHTEIYYDPFATNIEQILFPFLGDWN